MNSVPHHRPRRALKSIMFAQFFTLGCVNPVISMYLQNHLHFDALSTGLILSGSTIAAFTTPLIAAFIADRLVSSRILLSACNLLAGLANVALVFCTDPGSFFAAWMLLAVVQGPVPGLVNTLAFHHLEDGVRQYGPVRLWGTIGWVLAGWILSLAWMLLPMAFTALSADSFQPLIFWMALSGSLVTAGLGLLLPGKKKSPKDPLHTVQASGQASEPELAARAGFAALVPREALEAMKSPLFIVLAVLYFGGGLMDRLFYFGAAPYLPVAGFPQESVVAILTLGQIVEVFMLAILGRILTRMGFRSGILLGLGMQVLRPLLLAIPGPVSALAGIALHGVLVGFIHMGIIMQVNQQCDFRSRPGINQIFTFIFCGLASLAGNLGGGGLLNLAREWLPAGVAQGMVPGMATGQSGWSFYWLCNALFGVLFVLVFLLWYPRKDHLQEGSLQRNNPSE